MRDLSPAAELRRLRVVEKQAKRVLRAMDPKTLVILAELEPRLVAEVTGLERAVFPRWPRVGRPRWRDAVEVVS